MMEFASEPIPSDNQTVLSDITDNNETNTILSSFVIEDKLHEILQLFNAEVNKLNNDAVKEKAKEVGLSGLSKLKRPEIIQLLEAEFLKLLPALKEKRATDLKNISKCYGIKGVTGVKKDVIIYNMLLYCCATLTFTLNNAPETEPDVCSKAEPMDLVEQLEKQKMEIETKLKEELRVREEKRLEISSLTRSSPIATWPARTATGSPLRISRSGSKTAPPRQRPSRSTLRSSRRKPRNSLPCRNSPPKLRR